MVAFSFSDSFDKFDDIKKSISIIFLLTSTLLSIAIATTLVNYGAVELGALYYFFVCAIFGLATVIAFIIADTRLSRFRREITIMLIILNLIVGLLMRLDFHYDIF